MFPGSSLEQRSQLSSCCRGCRSQARRGTGCSELWSHGRMSACFVISQLTRKQPKSLWNARGSLPASLHWDCCPDLRVIKQSYKSISLTSFPFSLTGSLEGRGKSVGRSMGWRTEICGVLPADGRRPAKGSSTKDWIMQRIWGWGRTTAEPDCCSRTVSLPIFPSVMWCWAFWFFGVFWVFLRALYFKVKHL